jgi:hypothetical protein
MGRLFTFGCSFTHYAWPTWADVVAIDQDLELYNFGMAGLGNLGIHQRVLEADCKFNFTADDKIMIMWTSWAREDKIVGYDYEAGGSIFTKYPARWVRNNFDYADIVVKNSNAIIHTNNSYKKLISWQGSAFENTFVESETIDFKEFSGYDVKLCNAITNMYKEKMPKYNSISFKESGSKFSFDYLDDSHPDVNDHLNIVRESIIDLKPSTVELALGLHNDIKSLLKEKNCTDMTKAQSLISKLIKKKYSNTFYKVKSYEAFSSRIT